MGLLAEAATQAADQAVRAGDTTNCPIYTQDDMDVARGAVEAWRLKYEEAERRLGVAVAACGGRIEIPERLLIDEPPPVDCIRTQDPHSTAFVSSPG